MAESAVVPAECWWYLLNTGHTNQELLSEVWGPLGKLLFYSHLPAPPKGTASLVRKA